VLLARERLSLGDLAGAREDRQEAFKLDPNTVDAKALHPWSTSAGACFRDPSARWPR
jgi:hypothetical protein